MRSVQTSCRARDVLDVDKEEEAVHLDDDGWGKGKETATSVVEHKIHTHVLNASLSKFNSPSLIISARNTDERCKVRCIVIDPALLTADRQSDYCTEFTL